MRSVILFVIYFSICVMCFAQKKQAPAITVVEVAGTVQYQISMEWTEISDFKDKRTGTEFINFQRIPIQKDADSAKLFIVTHSCKVENARGANIKAYSVPRLAIFQKKKDFKIVKTFTNSDGLLKVAYSIGYWAYYTDENNIVHKIVIIHGIHSNGFGYQFFIDCPKDVFPALEQEITTQVSSIRFL